MIQGWTLEEGGGRSRVGEGWEENSTRPSRRNRRRISNCIVAADEGRVETEPANSRMETVTRRLAAARAGEAGASGATQVK